MLLMHRVCIMFIAEIRFISPRQLRWRAVNISDVVLFIVAVLEIALHALVLCLVLVLMGTVGRWWQEPQAGFWRTFLSMLRAVIDRRDANSHA